MRKYTLTPKALKARRQSGRTRSLLKGAILTRDTLPQLADISGGQQACWIWKGGFSSRGYGSFQQHGKKYGAHVAVYNLLIGPVPEGLELDHLCRNHACVNPSHLEPVTHRTNTLRGTAPTARNARKTHCKHGHEFTPENTGESVARGVIRGRRCKTCARLRYEAQKMTNKVNTL